MAPLPTQLSHLPLDIQSLVAAPLRQLAARAVPNNRLKPTQTIKPRTLASLIRRQQVTVTATTSASSNPKPLIPANYDGLGQGPSPGEVVGIVFGSVAGLLLVLWLIYTCFSMGNLAPASSVVEEDITISRRRSRSPRRHSVSSHSRSEIIEVSRQRSRSKSRSRSPVRSPPTRGGSRRETVIIEETRRQSRAPPPPVQDEFVEVIEEPSPPPSKSRRSSGRQSGFRTIDPDAYGGGDRPIRKVSRHG